MIMSHTPLPRTIGILAPYLGGIYCGSVIIGAARAARRRGARLVVAQETPRGIYQSRLAWDVAEGWIAVLNTDGADLIAQAGVPVVTVSSLAPNLPAVLPDNYSGMHVAVSHLIDHGHKRIAFIGRLAHVDIKQRFEGYKAALAERGIPFDEQLVIDAEDEMEAGGKAAARALLERGAKPTAVAASTDKNALGAMEVMRDAGLCIPGDLAIVGFDDIAEAQTADPPLTTVRQRFDMLAGVAVGHLLELLANKSLAPRTIHTPTALITRRSCGCEEAQVAALAASSGANDAEDWRAALERQLVQIVSYPFAPDPATPPRSIWPGLATLVEVVDGAIVDRAPPSAAAVESAWREAVVLTPDLDALNTALDLIEQAGWRQLANTARDEVAHVRLASALRLARRELMRARVARETTQIGNLDAILFANDEISTAMLGNVSTVAPALDWLRNTSARWGGLALWADPANSTELRLASAYARDGKLPFAPGARIVPASFPWVDPRAPADDETTIVTLLPLHTSRRAWGVLAIDGLVNTDATWNSDPVAMWSRMLGAALDRAALMEELSQQQEELRQQRETLQAAYDRERMLSGTVREIGCPVIPLFEGVLLIPLIGAIDSERAQQVIKVGLAAVGQERATDVLIDVTGVPIVDTQVAGALIQMARMTSLLGARTMLVGVRPEIAQSIVGLGIDLTQIEAFPSLAEAIKQLRRRRERSGLARHLV
jgi:DNA-binding LacI/PurR family transcriptional regulator/anti-anti-sigma regulatory factor